MFTSTLIKIKLNYFVTKTRTLSKDQKRRQHSVHQINYIIFTSNLRKEGGEGYDKIISKHSKPISV